jgi:hypothetical protein
MSGVLPALNRIAHDVVGAIAGPRLMILIFHRVHRVPDALFRTSRMRQSSVHCLHISSIKLCRPAARRAVAALRQGSLPPRSLSITFDDGYRDNAEVALPLLARYGIPATFFISTGFLTAQVACGMTL